MKTNNAATMSNIRVTLFTPDAEDSSKLRKLPQVVQEALSQAYFGERSSSKNGQEAFFEFVEVQDHTLRLKLSKCLTGKIPLIVGQDLLSGGTVSITNMYYVSLTAIESMHFNVDEGPRQILRFNVRGTITKNRVAYGSVNPEDLFSLDVDGLRSRKEDLELLKE